MDSGISTYILMADAWADIQERVHALCRGLSIKGGSFEEPARILGLLKVKPTNICKEGSAE